MAEDPRTQPAAVAALRTSIQGLAAAVLVAVVPVLLDALAGRSLLSEVDWWAAADRASHAAAVSLLMVALAWAQRKLGR